MKIDVREPEGNAFNIMSLVEQFLAAQGKSREDINDVIDEMRSGDYKHLLKVANTVTYDSFTFIGLDSEDKSQ